MYKIFNWFTAQSATLALRNYLNLISELVDYTNINKKVTDVVIIVYLSIFGISIETIDWISIIR